jgi:tetratricopeptide (TPR) repeat protein
MSETSISPSRSSPSSAIANRRIAFVGKLGGMNRREARELIRRYGATMADRVDESVDLIVIGADELPLDEADELLDEWTVQASLDGRLEIINETQLWQDLGLVDAEAGVEQLYTPAMLAQLLDLPIATIRRWHRRGLIVPARQVNRLAYFDFQEVASARRIARFIAAGASPKAVESKLSRLAQLYPDLQRPLSQLSVIVEGQDLLLRQGEGLIEPGGQMRLNFDSHESDSHLERGDGGDHSAIGDVAVIPLERPPTEPWDTDFDQFTTPDEFIALATELEDEGEVDAAIEVYRAMSLAYGPSADVSFRLAELLYQQHDLPAARERYYMTIELDETFVEARGSLGCVLVELGQLELALSAFSGALLHHADYPDVHFHLARLLDELGRPLEAETHWQQFLQLAPKSPWAEEARERLELEP